MEAHYLNNQTAQFDSMLNTYKKDITENGMNYANRIEDPYVTDEHPRREVHRLRNCTYKDQESHCKVFERCNMSRMKSCKRYQM
ncbi:hypothetical protein KIN20_004174 [Parelaphostrongylus tenuis]|uniref:Uncharacterized protein n=1 Tax=Parelaphostrongylus tenuis TaxID=148309 RepID=A0AAD5LY06_PARTN|nr:hypothetical protein KIN20_004174 [Parelaphostrongylus tenuis]